MTNEDLWDGEAQDDDLPVEVGDDFDEGLPYEEPVGRELPPREFKGWHRPRKHRVRTSQWLGAFKSLLPALIAVKPNRESVNYFGLPGSDMIDVTMFAAECSKQGVPLRYLGLDRSAGEGSVEGTYLNLAREELRRSGFVHRESDVLPDDFVSLADVRSPAYIAAKDLSFDIVNLDFCGSATNDPAGGRDSMYAAIGGLLKIQMARDEPWVLLLTGTFDRTGQSKAGELNAISLIDALRRGVEACGDESVSVARTVFGASDAIFPDPDSCSDQTFNHLHVLAFLRWISGVGKQHRTAKYRLTSVHSYRLHADRPAPDMFSIAVFVKPEPPYISDPAKLLPHAVVPDDCAELRQQTRRMDSVKDVDEELRNSDSLFESSRDGMADILGSRWYSKVDYLDSEFSRHIEAAASGVADAAG
ncbi:hypothetical protein GCM10029976_093110 [Kribbella albertanoniae]|uniref:Uncharacterized protein n=1 Tax=Kribbella albertanoniae TaxID=1266829 RepID=A0A4R4QD96_9ACTN|nr:hypothetical protein [Kribbella albertanoniae]TDC33149.1 hypothetical protein E1261_06570 [Kribbella albertanoniae]